MPELRGIHELEVYARHYYQPRRPFTPDAWKAHQNVLAIKGTEERIENLNQTMRLTGGGLITVTKDNPEVIREAFAAWVAKNCATMNITRPVFVPVPNRTAVDNVTDFPTAHLAAMCAERFGAGALSWAGLRFRKLLSKSDKRTWSLYNHLHCYGRVPEGEIILIDDIFTLGRHIAAATKRLGVIPSKIFVGGNTVKDVVEKPLNANTTSIIINYDNLFVKR